LHEQAEVYNLVTVEQVRVMADELRQRSLPLCHHPCIVRRWQDILEQIFSFLAEEDIT
jgi:hypothetical protein